MTKKDEWRIIYRKMDCLGGSIWTYVLERKEPFFFFWERWEQVTSSSDPEELEKRRFLILQKERDQHIRVIKEWKDA